MGPLNWRADSCEFRRSVWWPRPDRSISQGNKCLGEHTLVKYNAIRSVTHACKINPSIPLSIWRMMMRFQAVYYHEYRNSFALLSEMVSCTCGVCVSTCATGVWVNPRQGEETAGGNNDITSLTCVLPYRGLRWLHKGHLQNCSQPYIWWVRFIS